MLSDDREDMLTELVNIGIGRAAYTLSEMVDARIGLKAPRVSAGTLESVLHGGTAAQDSASVIVQSFSGGVSGTATLAISLPSARKLVAVLTNAPSESPEIDVEREAVLTEVGNIVINSVLGSLGNMATLDLAFGLPRYEETPIAPSSVRAPAPAPAVVVSVLFQIQNHSIEGELAVVFEETSLAGVWESLLDTPTDAPGDVQATT